MTINVVMPPRISVRTVLFRSRMWKYRSSSDGCGPAEGPAALASGPVAMSRSPYYFVALTVPRKRLNEQNGYRNRQFPGRHGKAPHPGLYSLEGLRSARRLLEDFVEGGISLRAHFGPPDR
jgi:hypothetical protein